VLSKRKGEELGRDFVVLNIRSIGKDRNRALAKHADKDTLMLAERLDAATVLLAKAFPVQTGYAGSYRTIGQSASLSKIDESAHGAGSVSSHLRRSCSIRFRFTPRSE
jgi:hypothetical protein